MLAQMAERINQIPDQNVIEFARLFNIELRPAAFAQTVIQFTTSGATEDVTVPAGTRVATEDESIIFSTVESLTIPASAATGEVAAQNLSAGHFLLTSGKLTKILDNIAFISSAANQSAIDSGSEVESIPSALGRMRRYQKRGERIVSAEDLEEAILDDALNGNGIVRAFPFIRNADFSTTRPGHTTVVVMTKTGESVDALALQRIAVILDQAIGNQYIYIVEPFYVDFNVSVNVRLNGLAAQGAILAAIENNLRAFYAPAREQFGRQISRAEIIAVVEGTGGVDRIVSDDNAPILASPLFDVKLADYQLPKLNLVNINVV